MSVEAYAFSDSPQHRRLLARRSAGKDAAFFLPHLRPGMRVLDCGCGPGSITLGLAAAVAPGEVIGIDLNAAEIAAARALATQRGVPNVRFVVASVYTLPFPDAAFDAAFAHALLQHLSEPARALKEVRRVLQPGGVAGLSDADYGTALHEPATPALETFQALLRRALEARGGSPYQARRQRRLLLDAGFAASEGHAVVAGGASGSLGQTRFAAAYFQLILQELIAPTALARGWADQLALDTLAAELRAWGERPDAFYALLTCQALGWVGPTSHAMHRLRHDPARLRQIAAALAPPRPAAPSAQDG